MRALWNGRLPLAQAFWEHAIIYAALANLAATYATFAALAAGLPGFLAVIVFLLPIPYIVAAIVGVWRSSDRYKGPQHWASLARIAAALWGGLMVLS